MTQLHDIFKAYDIRGLVPEQLNPDLARKVGSAFAAFAGTPQVLVGHDMRSSGTELAAAFTEGVTSAGVDVVLLGLISTDELFYASGALDSPGVTFTASHNPARYNGIKLCLAGREASRGGIGVGRHQSGGRSGRLPEPAARQVGHRQPSRRSGRLRHQGPQFRRPERPAPSPGSGGHRQRDGRPGGAGCVPGLPFHLEMLYGELDGTFPDHPADPIQAANLVDLQARVRETGADVGLAFDGDADRRFLVDDKAQP